MSNALKRKTNIKQTSNKIVDDYKLAEKCYRELFCSMQLTCYTVLYAPKEEGGFDFTKRRLQNFNRILTDYNYAYVNKELNSKDIEHQLRKTGFDCEKEAAAFPYRAKMKMIGKKKFKSMKEHNIILSSADVGIEAYLILAVHALKKNYHFTNAMIRQWWNKCREVADLYARGMTDDFVVQYFIDECDLKITRD